MCNVSVVFCKNSVGNISCPILKGNNLPHPSSRPTVLTPFNIESFQVDFTIPDLITGFISLVWFR